MGALVARSASLRQVQGTRVLRRCVYGVEPGNPRALLMAATVLALVAMAALAPPARRAARVDPAEALRGE